MSVDGATLMDALRPILTELRKDLVVRSGDPAVAAGLRAAHARQREQARTSDPYEVWLEERAAQIAAAWALSCVFVRTLEDRGLLERRRIAGPGAEDSEQQFLQLAPFLTARDYLLTVFRELSRLPGVREVFDPAHNPVWVVGPSAEVAQRLIGFFRPKGAGVDLRFDGEDTRFLGDLYEHLYEDIRERYALRQTPEFVEELILEETLDPAIRTFGLERVRVIDPACGSGHFLLGALRKIFRMRVQERPGDSLDSHVAKALKQIAGVDLNPYAARIARFRLVLEALRLCGATRLNRECPVEVAVGDSLLHGRAQRDLASLAPGGARAAWLNELFTFEDADAAERILSAKYQVVVGNPP